MIRTGLVSIFLFGLITACAFAEQRIGLVNASAIFEQYSQAREAEKIYQKEIEQLTKQVEEMERRLQELADTLKYRRYYFSEERLKEKQKELETRQEEYLRFRQDAEAKAAKRNDELSRPIVEAIQEAARNVAEKENMDLILDSSSGMVIFAKPEWDLTDKVLQLLEEKGAEKR
ncbi:MAG: OmpH family outer membrane protein [bacterium]